MKWQADREKTWADISARLSADHRQPSLRVLVLAAHPDDETIGASLVLSRCPDCFVAYLTDGAPRDTRLWPPRLTGSRELYVDLRRQEAHAALSIAGISSGAISWLRAVDQEATFEIDRLIADFAKLVCSIRPDVVITHPYEGGHPDHDAAALVARIAEGQCDRLPILLEMTSYHARDGRCVTGEFLNPEESSQICLELSTEDRERKQRMIEAHASQKLVLENFPLDREPLRLAPEYDFSQPPHAGKLWYESMGWEMTGTRWRELVANQVQACR
ncbi:MAG TPA: PIG-L deacetylase family protein [Terriglobales bacterium]|nr:PIG-L deacetylase family protein [Terriglobales bacterium]